MGHSTPKRRIGETEINRRTGKEVVRGVKPKTILRKKKREPEGTLWPDEEFKKKWQHEIQQINKTLGI